MSINDSTAGGGAPSGEGQASESEDGDCEARWYAGSSPGWGWPVGESTVREGGKAPEAPWFPEAFEFPGAAGVREEFEVPEAPGFPEAFEFPEVPGFPEVFEFPEAPGSPEAFELLEVPGFAGASEFPEAAAGEERAGADSKDAFMEASAEASISSSEATEFPSQMS
jgi:hypothetical protein